MPDWNKVREDFPITKKYAYLANAAIASEILSGCLKSRTNIMGGMGSENGRDKRSVRELYWST